MIPNPASARAAKREVLLPATLIFVVFTWAFDSVRLLYERGADSLGLPWWVGAIFTAIIFIVVAARLWSDRHEA